MAKYLKTGLPSVESDAANVKVQETVAKIIADIRERGDAAVRELSDRFDGWSPPDFQLSRNEIDSLVASVPRQTIEDIRFAQAQIRNFAEHQRAALKDIEVETVPGVRLGHRNIPVSSAGCYTPGGRYPMVASAHMTIVTAKVAGVDRIIACTPPTKGKPHAATIAPVDMIVGAGNAFVAEAKRQLFGEVGIDLLAGPTEILIVADDSADVGLVAVDLLGQAEHGPTSPAALITTSESLALSLPSEIERRLAILPTADVASVAWRDFGQIILVSDLAEAV